jgi:hypothetical protein
MKRLLIMLVLGAAALACTPSGSSPNPSGPAPAAESPSNPAESPADSVEPSAGESASPAP